MNNPAVCTVIGAADVAEELATVDVDEMLELEAVGFVLEEELVTDDVD